MAEEAVLPDEINDRAADNWEPLAAVADAAGNGWAERARRAAIVLSTQPIDEERAEIRLLADVRELFKRGPTKIATSTLIEDLRSYQFAESGWDDWRGQGIKAVSLARLLRPFGIRSQQMKIGGEKVRGFALDQFVDTFARYLAPDVPDSTRYPGTDSSDAAHRSRFAKCRRENLPACSDRTDGRCGTRTT